MWQHIKNIYYLGIKEIIELSRDYMLLALIIYAFSLGIYVSATGESDSVQNATIAIVDEDETQLSQRIADAMQLPLFLPAVHITRPEIDGCLDRGEFTFVLVIPVRFERDVLGGYKPELQLNVDATRMSQAFVGAGYIEQIASEEIVKYVNKEVKVSNDPATTVIRNKYNPNLTASWSGAINELINNVTLLAIILVGAALIRERERGTLEHLLVMPVTPFEIMCAKVWSTSFVVLLASACAVFFIIRSFIGVPIAGSVPLYIFGVALHLFAVTSLGIFLACVAQNMPQLGLLVILIQLPMNMLSGGNTPRESMPVWVQDVMSLSPTTHFVKFSHQILFRGGGWDVIWQPFLWIAVIGLFLFCFSLSRFKKTAT